MKLFEYAIEENLAGNIGELCKKIGLAQSGLADIRRERRSFTHAQLHELARLTNADMNWIYGFSSNMFREHKNAKPTQVIRQAVAEIELAMKEMKGKKR